MGEAGPVDGGIAWRDQHSPLSRQMSPPLKAEAVRFCYGFEDQDGLRTVDLAEP